METIIWVFVVLCILGDVVSKQDNAALKMGFVIMVSSLLTVICMIVNDLVVVKCALVAVKAAPGLVEAWESFKDSLEEIKFYYNMEKEVQA